MAIAELEGYSPPLDLRSIALLREGGRVLPAALAGRVFPATAERQGIPYHLVPISMNRYQVRSIKNPIGG